MGGNPTSNMPGPSPRERYLLVWIALLLGVVIGQAGGVFAVLSGSTLPAAVIAGAVAFGSSVSLVVGIMCALGLLRS
jgi:hypothetical protein